MNLDAASSLALDHWVLKMDTRQYHVKFYLIIPALTFAPLVVAVCKKQTKNYYDENHKIQERKTLKLNFTIDQRFVDAHIAKNISRDVKIIVVIIA